MRMSRLSGLVEHFMRRRSSVMRSTEGTSSKFAMDESFSTLVGVRVRVCRRFQREVLWTPTKTKWKRTREVSSFQSLLFGPPNASNTSSGLYQLCVKLLYCPCILLEFFFLVFFFVFLSPFSISDFI